MRAGLLRIALVSTLAVAATGCGCDAILKLGIVVTIIDGATGNPFYGDVTVTATEGSYTDTASPPAHPPNPRIVALVPERRGTYRVEVQAPGYVTWVATNVRVIHDGCHVVTVELTAELQPATG